jgi:hypothetical protein
VKDKIHERNILYILNVIMKKKLAIQISKKGNEKTRKESIIEIKKQSFTLTIS